MARKLVDTESPPDIVPVVTPDGKIKHLAASGGTSHQQLQRFVDDETGSEEYAISPKFARAGWELLQDMYRKEKNTEGFKQYMAWLSRGRKRAPTKGQKAETVDRTILPRELQRRLAEAEAPAEDKRKGKVGG